MNKFHFQYPLLIAGLLFTHSYGVLASDCPECKKFEKGVTTTVDKTGKALKNLGEDIGKGLDKMLRWAFTPQK